MQFPFSFFNVSRAAPEASSSTSAGESRSSAPMPHLAAGRALPSRSRPCPSDDSAMPPAKRRAVPGNEAQRSPLEALPSEVVHQIAGRLPAQDVVSAAATSTAMKAASEPPLADLKRAANLARDFLAVRTLTEFTESLSLLKNNGLSEDLHASPLTSLGTVINGLPEPERPEAAREFVKSVDEFAKHMARSGRALAGEASLLLELHGAAQQGPQELARREKAAMQAHAVPRVAAGSKVNEVVRQFGLSDAGHIHELERSVTETRGRAAINAGENAQEVAARLGVCSKRLEQMSASRGSSSRPAGPAYRAVTEGREDFDRILQRFGITNPEVVDRLRVVHSSSLAAVTRGDNVEHVIERFGILPGSNDHVNLAQASVQGPAGQAVREGMSPEDAERHYGLESAPFMGMQLKRIAEARDARAAEGQSLVGRVLRGAGRLVRGAARQILEQTLEDAPRRASRAAVRSLAGSSGTAPAAMLAATSMAAHGRIGHERGGRRPGATDDGRLDRIMAEAERDVARLPMRPRRQRPA